MPFCVMEAGRLLVDTTYEHEELAKIHYLSFNTGDYDESDFYHLPGRLSASKEFTKYPDAETVQVALQLVGKIH